MLGSRQSSTIGEFYEDDESVVIEISIMRRLTGAIPPSKIQFLGSKNWHLVVANSEQQIHLR